MRNRVLIYTEALDVAAEGAVWYARRIGDGSFDALHVPVPGSDTGIHARWFDYTGGEPRLDVRPARMRSRPCSARSNGCAEGMRTSS
jgi:hypothetical protein